VVEATEVESPVRFPVTDKFGRGETTNLSENLVLVQRCQIV
jgi:hypothetical protein